MRKTLITAALPLVLLLAGCSGAGVDSVELSADPVPGTAPSVTFDTPLRADDVQVKVLRDGTGPEIAEGDTLLVHGAAYSGSDRSSVGETYSQGAGQLLTLAEQFRESSPEFHDALVGAKEGAIIAYSAPRPPTATTTEGDDSTSVEVYEVVRKIPGEVEGEMRDSPEGLPAVTENEEGVPVVAEPEGEAPDGLVSEYLIEGDGEEVAEGDTVIANYVGVKWSDGEVFDSSYDRGVPASFPLANVIEGWKEGLVGKKAGSRVLLSVPVDQAYGTEEELGDNANDYPAGDLLFVVDLLAAVDTPEPPAAAEPSAPPSSTAPAEPSASATER